MMVGRDLADDEAPEIPGDIPRSSPDYQVTTAAQSEASSRADETFSRRQFLTYAAVIQGAPMALAIEAVASTALEHPEWDMDEQMTWAEWNARSE